MFHCSLCSIGCTVVGIPISHSCAGFLMTYFASSVSNSQNFTQSFHSKLIRCLRTSDSVPSTHLFPFRSLTSLFATVSPLFTKHTVHSTCRGWTSLFSCRPGKLHLFGFLCSKSCYSQLCGSLYTHFCWRAQ